MARFDNKIAVTELTAGSKFEYEGHKYRVVEVIIQSGIAFVYIAKSLFPMEFYADNEVNLISA
jgi:hypothetical protein